MTAEREMTLDEWVERLPLIHRARKELAALREENTRLRDGYLADENGNEYVAVCVLKEKIRELEAERADALNQRDKFHDYWYSNAKRADRVEAERDALRAENERLKSSVRLSIEARRLAGNDAAAYQAARAEADRYRKALEDTIRGIEVAQAGPLRGEWNEVHLKRLRAALNPQAEGEKCP